MRHVLPSLHAFLDACVRALAVFAAANALMGVASSAWDANGIWIHGGALPPLLVTALVGLFAAAVLLGRRLGRGGRIVARGTAIVLAVACLADALAFYRLRSLGHLHDAAPVPLSLGIAALLLAWVVTARVQPLRADGRTRRALWLRVAQRVTPIALVGVGTLLHILAFGATDYRRPADAAIVFGAAVRADGSPSPALRDRIRTACDLYRQGLVHTLVLSGGRDPRAPLSEPACMARVARELGVPAEALLLDEGGRNTRASLLAVREIAQRRGWRRLLMVSHDYHLARIHLESGRLGIPALTVPARESVAWAAKPLFVAREVLAWGYAYVRPLRG